MILPRFIAHRGANRLAPENTLKAFKVAEAHGAKMFECDVLLSQDGIPVIFHDDTLERCTNGQGLIREASFAYLQTLNAGEGERIPSLFQLLDWFKHSKMLMNLELKYAHPTDFPTPLVQSVCEQIAPFQNRILISSFHWEALYQVRKIFPHITIGLLIDEANLTRWGLAGIVEWVNKLQAFSLHCDLNLLTAARIQAFLKMSPHLLAYTVNDPEVTTRLFQAGVEAVFSDHLSSV